MEKKFDCVEMKRKGAQKIWRFRDLCGEFH